MGGGADFSAEGGTRGGQVAGGAAAEMAPGAPGIRLADMRDEALRARIANDPSAVVMQPTYDNVFEPWATQRLLAAVDRVVEVAVALGDELAVDKRIQADAELAEFSKLHPELYSILRQRNVASDARMLGVVRFMVETRDRYRRGEVSDMTARAAVSDRALAAVMSAQREREASEMTASAPGEREPCTGEVASAARAPMDESPRIEELPPPADAC